MAKIIHQPHDKLFKLSMHDLRVARELLDNNLPPELLACAKFNTLTPQKESFIDHHYSATEADVIYSMQLSTGGLAYIYILCEHQSTVDANIAFRLLVYTVRLMENYRKKYPQKPLPLVYPLVVYSGEKIWDAPKDIFELFGENAELARKFLLQPYQLIDIHRLSDQQLHQQFWSGLLQFALKYRKPANLECYLDEVLPWCYKVELKEGTGFAKIVLKYLIDGIEAEDEQTFIKKIDQHLSGKMRSDVMTLAQRFEQKGIEKGWQAGRDEGWQEGCHEGRLAEKQDTAKNLLRLGVRRSLIQRATGLSDLQLDALAQRLEEV